MKLTYRGVDYDYNPPMLEVTEGDSVCTYRGHAARYRYVQHVPIPQPAERLTYRGVPYQTTRYGSIAQIGKQPVTAMGEGQVSDTAFATLRSKLSGSTPASKARRQLLQEASQHHQESIARTLRHRIDVARAQGNDALVKQLEVEMQQIV